jgi:hypothetical protein
LNTPGCGAEKVAGGVYGWWIRVVEGLLMASMLARQIRPGAGAFINTVLVFK